MRILLQQRNLELTSALLQQQSKRKVLKDADGNIIEEGILEIMESRGSRSRSIMQGTYLWCRSLRCVQKSMCGARSLKTGRSMA